MKTVRFYHFRFSWDNEVVFSHYGNVWSYGGATLCVFRTGEETCKVGAAYCSVGDLYQDEVGERISLEDAVHSKYFYPVKTDPRVLLATKVLAGTPRVKAWAHYIKKHIRKYHTRLHLYIYRIPRGGETQRVFEVDVKGSMTDTRVLLKAKRLLDYMVDQDAYRVWQRTLTATVNGVTYPISNFHMQISNPTGECW